MLKPSIRFVLEKAVSPLVQMIGSKQYEAQQAANPKRAHYLKAEADRLLDVYQQVMTLADRFEEQERNNAKTLYGLAESEAFHRSLLADLISRFDQATALPFIKMQSQIIGASLRDYQNATEKEKSNVIHR